MKDISTKIKSMEKELCFTIKINPLMTANGLISNLMAMGSFIINSLKDYNKNFLTIILIFYKITGSNTKDNSNKIISTGTARSF